MSSNLPKDMQVVEISAPGKPDVLRSATRAVPVPAAGEVLIKVAAAGVNGPDMMQRKGLYPAPAGASDLLGLEVSGEIVALGSGVARWKTGDKVTALTNGGGYAEYCAVEAQHCLPIPAGISLRDAGSLPETFFTVWSNVFMGAALKSGETLLVHGGAGGIGATAIQLAKAFGAAEGKVYGSSGAMREKVVSGEQILAFNVIGSYALQWAKDSPVVGVSFASDYTAAFQRVASVTKNAPHPAAGRLFLDFMLSEKGQAILAGKGVPSLRTGYKGPLDSEEIAKLTGGNMKVIPINEKLVGTMAPKLRAEFFQAWKKAMRGEG